MGMASGMPHAELKFTGHTIGFDLVMFLVVIVTPVGQGSTHPGFLDGEHVAAGLFCWVEDLEEVRGIERAQNHCGRRHYLGKGCVQQQEGHCARCWTAKMLVVRLISLV